MAKNQQLAAIQSVCLVLALIAYRRLTNRNRVNLPTRDMMLHRKQVREEMLRDLLTSGKCRQLIRMSENAFRILCQKLERDGGLRPTQRMTIQEQVARFLHIVGNDFRNRFVSWSYRRSGSATSGHFHRVLDAIITLEDQ
ncbi:harbinger transposase-derived nuclease domain-containing protein [Artemisia annua]|uniref:Harbinger transposase-derived nuclease domain-containing protein n=1 Tax=Artemisia annua TaxID=35608 RepID=A0A2U1KH76_ARTAN|nr:harbinger transposase-derived nuclease domain-containing protein [Artemisia annua]